jgi:hypothetical protein
MGQRPFITNRPELRRTTTAPSTNSKKSKSKKRLWIHEDTDWYSVICYNCGLNTNLVGFLGEINPERLEHLKMLCMDAIKDGSVFRKKKKEKVFNKKPTNKLHETLRQFLAMNCFHLEHKQEDENHEKLRKFAIQKMKKRNLREEYWSTFYFCYKGTYRWRIIIPFIDDKGLLYYFQARDINPKSNSDVLKYLTSSFEGVEFPDNRLYNFYGVDPKKRVYICEGMFDSMFLDNCIALGNANVTGRNAKLIYKTFHDRVWVMDNPWIDETGYDRSITLLENDEKCFLMPKEHKDCKDLNDLAIKLGVEELDPSIIENNILIGKKGIARMKIITMRILK